MALVAPLTALTAALSGHVACMSRLRRPRVDRGLHHDEWAKYAASSFILKAERVAASLSFSRESATLARLQQSTNFRHDFRPELAGARVSLRGHPNFFRIFRTEGT